MTSKVFCRCCGCSLQPGEFEGEVTEQALYDGVVCNRCLECGATRGEKCPITIRDANRAMFENRPLPDPEGVDRWWLDAVDQLVKGRQ